MADLLKISHAAGHSKYDTPGKQDPEGIKEWEYTSEIVKLVIEELSHYENVAQLRVDDPSGKKDISLSKRCQLANDWGSHVHIDYHLNAFGTGWSDPGGTETYVYTTKPKEAVALAEKIQANLVSELGFANRGVKTANFHMLRETKMTAVLPEIAFMTNKNEAYKMRTKEYQKKATNAIVNALVAQYGLKKRKVVSKVAEKENLKEAWGYESIQKAIDKGIIPGYSDGSWQPNRPITRADIAVILDRLGLLK